MDKLFALFKSREFLALAGLLLLAALIWLGGPYLGIGDAQPLASPAPRLALILLAVTLWLACRQVRQWRASAKARRMAGELGGQDARLAESDTDARTAAERRQLQQRFQEAMDVLRKTRRGGRDLYALPWYAVIGSPGSGKSTLLQHSGLEFSLLDRFGKRSLGGVGGTRNCDWWFTDEAVFLDTAGRYTTQDSDAMADASAWEAFLGLLRKYRRRRPLNGVIVTVSITDLLTLDHDGRRQHARTVRQRLEELELRLRIGIPVYLVFTKCDLVAGFGEFFDDLDARQRGQVWGMSFPAERTIDGGAADLFGAEFDLLLERLDARVIDRLHAERDPARRAAVLSFPMQLRMLREAAAQFVEGAFARDAYAKPVLLRGAYFTSGTQEGTPIDRLLTAVARIFGIDASRAHVRRTQRRTYFVERLLKDVLFPESGFVGTSPALERRKLALQTASHAGIAALTVLLMFGLASSHARNRDYTLQVREALRAYPDPAPQAGARTIQAHFAEVLRRLDALAQVRGAAQAHRRDGVPLSMRFGLYQGGALGREVEDAYQRELNGILLPGVAAGFREGLNEAANDPQMLYYFLKGYLMLGEPAHRDAEELAILARTQWQRIFPDDPSLQDALDTHFQALLAGRQAPRALPLDTGRVEQARATLRTADLSTLVYGGLKLAGPDAGAAPVRLDRTLGLLGDVFHRKSGTPLSQPLPALFTRPAFAAQIDQGIEQAVQRFLRDDWVFGAGHVDVLERSRLSQQVLALYQRDYIQAWDGLMNDLQLRPVGNLQEASTVAAKLAGPSSPLKALLDLLRENTRDLLREPPAEAAGAGDGVAAAVEAKVRQEATRRSSALARLLQASADGTAGEDMPSEGTLNQARRAPDAPIGDHFAELNRLTEGAPGATPLDRTLATLDQLSRTLLTVGDFGDASGRPDPALLIARQQAEQLPPPVSDWIAALTGKSQALAARSASNALEDGFRQIAGGDCALFVQGRYPFSPDSPAEIPLQNFAELFGNGGRFDAFFKQALSGRVDTGRAQWQWKADSGSAQGPAALLAQAQIADGIRQAYFRGGNQPEVAFTLLAPQLGAGIGRLLIEVDGQQYDYRPGGAPSMAMTWPGPQPGLTRISAWDAGGSALPIREYPGEWGFFRALRAAGLKRQTDLRYAAGFDFGPSAATVVVQAASLKHPFMDTQVRRFRCPS
ncbi:type VI secretion system membrane subunit TssM [Pseudoxanthomonas putridarboris]|uniref:Type VI secretion system membrane subunit TssM n=1 Tax=Pseudoxanthomonas putridarboris TaxID=752605 RepID=A0ABU9J385_9GAMM